MNLHKPNVIPLKTPYRIAIIRSRAEQEENEEFLNKIEANLLFKLKDPKDLTTNNSIFSKPISKTIFSKTDKLTLPQIRKPSTSLSPAPKTVKSLSSSGLSPFSDTRVTNTHTDANFLSTRDKNYLIHTPGLEMARSNLSSTSRSCGNLIAFAKEQAVKEMSLVNNPLSNAALQGVLSALMKPNPSLCYLNLENTGIADRDVHTLCEVLSNDRTLLFLGLARNNLTHHAARYLKIMLIENYYIQKLDLHWNSLSSQGAWEIFEGLCSNASLKELDLSWNSIGRCRTPGSIFKLSEAFKNFQGLAHLDLSFNYFTVNEIDLLGKGLADNYEILGLHIVGNEGKTDPQGFLNGKEGSIELKDSHLFTRIFQETRKFKKPAKSHCWLCEKWTEHEFEFDFDEFEADLSAYKNIFIHLEVDGFEAELVPKTDGKFKLSRVLPTGLHRFFLSLYGDTFVSGKLEIEVLESEVSMEAKYSEVDKFYVKSGILNVVRVNGVGCDYRKPFGTLPRRPKFGYMRQSMRQIKQVWTVEKSIFKDFRSLSPDFISQCLNFDWFESRLSTFIRSTHEQQLLKQILQKIYPALIDTFKYLSVQSGNEFPSIGSNVFIDFLNQGQFFDSNYSLSDLGVNWNSVIVPKTKQLYNPGNALVRYEFVEILVRIAFDRYIRNKVCKTISESFLFFLSENLERLIHVNNSEKWRKEFLYEENVDIVLRSFKPVFEAAFRVYSGKKALPGQKPFMSLDEFRGCFMDAKILDSTVPGRDLEGCFYLAMNWQVDELNEKKHVEMGFLEFLEGFCRAVGISNVGEGKSFKGKVLEAAKMMVLVCPKNVQDGFVVPSKQVLNSLRMNPKKYRTFALK